MFNSMGHAWYIRLVAEVSNIDVHGSAGLIRLGIMDEEGLQLVRKADYAIGPIIQGRGLEMIRH